MSNSKSRCPRHCGLTAEPSSGNKMQKLKFALLGLPGLPGLIEFQTFMNGTSKQVRKILDIQTDSISALKTMPARQDHEKVQEER